MFDTQLQKFQYYDKYSRFDYDLGRRERWDETVDRAREFLHKINDERLPDDVIDRVAEAIRRGDVMPSMRLLAMAGKSAARTNVAIYNCSYLSLDGPSAFVEMLTISMSGTGIGYSVESRYVNQFPVVSEQRGLPAVELTVADSSEGWAMALATGLDAWFHGEDVEFDYSLIRPSGAPLRTKGGRASGPEPLRKLLDFARDTILSRQGGKLTTLDVHDIACMIGDTVIQGGVRRTALIALFDADDEQMLSCKSPKNIVGNYHRYNANNSAVWERRMSHEEIGNQMRMMASDGTGEPGIFSRHAIAKTIPDRRNQDFEFGTNPCGEIILRPRQFCNLSQAIIRPYDTEEDIADKVFYATILGTLQSAADYFPGLPDTWKWNSMEERLLGVDLNGQLDNPLFQQGEEELSAMLRRLQSVAVETNKVTAELMDINQSAAVTCVKPSGNSSVMLNTSPGLHPRHSRHYIRRVRVNRDTPMYNLLYMSGKPMVPDVGQDPETATTWVAEFYIESPDDAVVKGDRDAIAQLNYWLIVKKNWAEHNPSCTITYRPDELEAMIDWLYENQDYVGGLSFLPESDAHYELMPYEAIDEETFYRLASADPVVNFELIFDLDNGVDNTTAAQELACVAGFCEI